jgi:hypothetical protein
MPQGDGLNRTQTGVRAMGASRKNAKKKIKRRAHAANRRIEAARVKGQERDVRPAAQPGRQS